MCQKLKGSVTFAISRNKLGKFVLVSPPDNVLEVTRHQHHVLRCELIVGVPPDWRRLASPGAPGDVARRGFDSTVVRVPSSPQTIHPR
jgi:hypothetical protein